MNEATRTEVRGDADRLHGHRADRRRAGDAAAARVGPEPAERAAERRPPNPFPDLDRPPAPPYAIAPEAIEPTVQMLTAMRDSQADEPVWREHGERGATHAALNGFIAFFSERLRATPPDTILWQLS